MHRSTKSCGSVKIGHACQSNIKVHLQNAKLTVQYCNTHLSHTHEIGKQRLFVEDWSKIAGNLVILNCILNCCNNYNEIPIVVVPIIWTS